MPGEFERHAGTWMAWPRRPDNWRDAAGPAREAFAAVAAAIARSEPVAVAAHPDDVAGAQAHLGAGITAVPVPSIPWREADTIFTGTFGRTAARAIARSAAAASEPTN